LKVQGRERQRCASGRQKVEMWEKEMNFSFLNFRFQHFRFLALLLGP
jgi:hypothetical protein